MKNLTFVLIATALCFTAGILGAVAYSRMAPAPERPVAGVDAPPFTIFKTIQTVSVGTAPTQVVATSTDRSFVNLQNIGSTVAYCAPGTRNAADQQGFMLPASSTLRFPFGNEVTFGGAINCIASSTVSILVQER